MAVNEATSWRLALARHVAAAYIANPGVKAVVVNGSVGRGSADRYSDIEISVFWADHPCEQDRRAAVERAGGTDLQLWPLYQPDEEYSSSYLVGGVKVDLGEFTVETMERFLDDVVQRADIADYKQILIAAVVYGTPVHSDTLIGRWRERAAGYPRELSRAMVLAHCTFNLSSADMLAERDDLLMFYDLICTAQRQILGILLGLNRLYLANPRYKWLDQLVSELRIAPAALAFRLKQLFRTDPRLAVHALQAIIDETLALVEQHMPELDMSAASAQAHQRRTVLDQPPAALSERLPLRGIGT